MATALALDNVFLANLAEGTVLLGAAHGSYGVGGVLAPIIATALVSRGVPWQRYYLITLGIRLLCMVSAGWAFWGYEKEETTRLFETLERTASRRAAAEHGEPSTMHLLKKSLKNRVTLIGALFIFSYQGAEVSISGWVISYLIEYRHGDPSHVGYVTAGFWVSEQSVRADSSMLTSSRVESRQVVSSSLTLHIGLVNGSSSMPLGSELSRFSYLCGLCRTLSATQLRSRSSGFSWVLFTLARRPSSLGFCRGAYR